MGCKRRQKRTMNIAVAVDQDFYSLLRHIRLFFVVVVVLIFSLFNASQVFFAVCNLIVYVFEFNYFTELINEYGLVFKSRRLLGKNEKNYMLCFVEGV